MTMFLTQNERKTIGGTCFYELQFCRLPESAPIKKIVSVDSIEHWKDDSIYVSDDSDFYEVYSRIFTGGVYNNLQTGVVDTCGINYYSPELTQTIIARLQEEKPEEYEVLLSWLKKAEGFNGFYILGI